MNMQGITLTFRTKSIFISKISLRLAWMEEDNASESRSSSWLHPFLFTTCCYRHCDWKVCRTTAKRKTNKKLTVIKTVWCPSFFVHQFSMYQHYNDVLYFFRWRFADDSVNKSFKHRLDNVLIQIGLALLLVCSFGWWSVHCPRIGKNCCEIQAEFLKSSCEIEYCLLYFQPYAYCQFLGSVL